MRTKILSLLLALLAISNFSFAGDKHSAHSIGFIKAAQNCFELKDELELEENPLFKENVELLVLPDNEDVEMGMVITGTRLEALKKMGDKISADNYYWIFNWNNFVYTWDEKWNLEHSNSDEKWFKEENGIINLTSGKGNNLINRLALLLGLDIQPSHIYLCKFSVNSNSIFRPAYETSIKCNKIVKNDGIDKYQFNTTFLDKFGNNEIEVKYGEYKLPCPKVYLAHLQQMREYPWTRLGYTYDWGNNEKHKGVYEFVLMPNTEMKNIVIYNLETGEKVMGE